MQQRKLNYLDFKKFFYSGIDNKEELEEGLMYYASKIVNKRIGLTQLYDMTEEEKIEELINETKRLYLQYYRFIKLNDIDENYTGKVENKILEDEIYEIFNRKKDKQHIMFTKAGIFHTSEQYFRFNDRDERGVSKNNWTKDVCEILEYLSQLEDRDKIEYYKKWLEVKLQRVINRENPKELEKVQYIIGEIEKRIIEKIKCEEEDKSMYI